MTDREKYLTILDRFYRGRGGSLLTKDESEALDYAISSIKTDLKYDLLYEETKHIANVSKKIESTPDDCETCIHNKGVLECDMYGCKYEPKNDLGVDCQYTDEEIAKSFREDVEAVKDPLFMVKQWLEHTSTAKNDLGIDVPDNNVGKIEPVIRDNRVKDELNRVKDELEPTTKTCKTCRNFGTHHGICEICKDNKCWTEKEPTTKNDLGLDCISRADARSLICKIDIKHHMFGMSRKAFKDLYNGMDELPSVTPQPKHGIWQQINKNEVNVIPEYKCSECGAEYKGFGFDFDYCPRCGCAMEEEE